VFSAGQMMGRSRSSFLWSPFTGQFATVDIPYRPLPGLAYSWAFWAGLAYIGLTGASFVQVHRRLRKGKCPRCAYALAGLARCPECGTVVKSDGLEARPIGE
jgi:hypothetical protein